MSRKHLPESDMIKCPCCSLRLHRDDSQSRVTHFQGLHADVIVRATQAATLKAIFPFADNNNGGFPRQLARRIAEFLSEKPFARQKPKAKALR